MIAGKNLATPDLLKGGNMIKTIEELKKLIAEQISENIKEKDSLRDDLFFDDLDRAELVLALEETFNIEITNEEAANWKIVQDIINYIQSKGITLT